MIPRRRGLSVIEILVAIVLLGVGVIFALGAISYATKATTGSVQATEATAYARKILELVLGGGQKGALLDGQINPVYQTGDWRPLYGPDQGVARPFEQADFISGSDAAEARAFRHSAAEFDLRVSVAPYVDPAAPLTPLAGLYAVDVQLRWRDRLGLRTHSFPALYREE